MVKTVSINISLPQDQIQYVQSLVDSGLYVSKSEVVRDALRLMIWLHSDLYEPQESAPAK